MKRDTKQPQMNKNCLKLDEKHKTSIKTPNRQNVQRMMRKTHKQTNGRTQL